MKEKPKVTYQKPGKNGHVLATEKDGSHKWEKPLSAAYSASNNLSGMKSWGSRWWWQGHMPWNAKDR